MTKEDSLYFKVEAGSQNVKKPPCKNSQLRPTMRDAVSELSGARGHNSRAFDVLSHFVSNSTSEREKNALPFCFAFI